MKTLNFSIEQVTQIVTDLQSSQSDYGHLQKIFLEALMGAEREVFNQETGDKSNGYRPRRAFGGGRVMELRVPRTRFGSFYPVLLNVLKDQQSEMQRLTYSLYTSGLTTEQIGDIFDEIYGKHYSKQRVSQMMDYAREEVQGWLERPLDEYYPILYIDCTFVPVRRDGMVRKEAFYTVLGVKPDRTREVLCVVNAPSENRMGWQTIIEQIYQRGAREIGLVVSDGLKGIEDAIAAVYGSVPHQLCVVHLKRNLDRKVHLKDRQELQSDLRKVFTIGESDDSPAKGYQRFTELLEKWSKKYKAFNYLKNEPRYMLYFTYLAFDKSIQSMIYSTNWIERLNRDYKRVLRMRGALPNADAAILLMAQVAMSRKAFERKIPKINSDIKNFNWTE
jgi:transposase-like protein